MKIIQLETNHLVDPIGFRMDRPVLSYKVTEAVGKVSAAQRIEIALDPAFTKTVLDTGETQLDSKGFVPELALQPATRYYWRVSVTSDAGEAACSEPAFFETAPERIGGKWIRAPFEKEIHPLFRRRFSLPDEVRSARLYITGLGLYEALLNGKKVTDEYLTPFYNGYNHFIQYQTYDVTAQLHAGENVLGVMLGNGWYRGRFGLSQKYCYELYGSRMQLLCELRVELKNGQTLSVTSDEQFLCAPGPVLGSNIYDGERYDSTREIPLWAEVGCDEAVFVPAEEAEDKSSLLQPRLSPPLRLQEALKPVEILHTPAGETVLDFGQNMTGLMFFRCRAPKGATVTLHFGEILQDGNFYTENLRSAREQFIYVADGTLREVRQHFTFYGFRYMKVEGIEDVRAEDFTARVLHSELRRTGWLETSDPKVNRLVENALWGQKGNFVDTPTDCPQRDERLGWTGDAQVFCATANFNMECAPFYRKFLYDMLCEQQEPILDGAVPDVVPDVLTQRDRLAGKARKGGTHSASCGWADAAAVIPWTGYLFTGDRTLLEEQYENMKLWTDFIRRTDETECGSKRLWTCGTHYADWLALDTPDPEERRGGTDPYYICSAYYLYSAELTAKAAAVLGYTEDAASYRQLAEEVRQAMRQEYFTPTGRLAVETQTGLVLALYFGIAPEEARPRLIEALRQKMTSTHITITARKGEQAEGVRLQTGFIGTAYLCKALSEVGLTDYAYTLLLREEYPGWLYEVNMGATTVWERWNSVMPDGHLSSTGMNSLNHYAYGSIVEWMYRYMAGIRPLESAPGFRRFVLAPEPDARFEHLKARFDSPYGLIESAWEKTESGWRFTVTVPFDTTAEFRVPASMAGCAVQLDGSDAGVCAELEPGRHEITVTR